ncbi:MAG: methylated-DNA--[protein]-cysteine S-methyltransferase [Candidatus Omnitrophica bacterium]|nr:methylated-DNA--[protein]-cysteine S-methyltransferase [Candidatus Omnitrophota bacterium]
MIEKREGLTVFQKKVLLATMEIPEGETRTYAWVASRAGHPGASRAAGNALARNPFPPYVPCHRVIASGGSLGGYSGKGGVAAKKKLLAREGVII